MIVVRMGIRRGGRICLLVPVHFTELGEEMDGTEQFSRAPLPSSTSSFLRITSLVTRAFLSSWVSMENLSPIQSIYQDHGMSGIHSRKRTRTWVSTTPAPPRGRWRPRRKRHAEGIYVLVLEICDVQGWWCVYSFGPTACRAFLVQADGRYDLKLLGQDMFVSTISSW
jgi:hypothetical protein